jgi:hypothetical protein
MLKNKYNIGDIVWFISGDLYQLEIKEGLILEAAGVWSWKNSSVLIENPFTSICYFIYPLSIAPNGEKFLCEEDSRELLSERKLFSTKKEALEYLQAQINKQRV